VLEEYLRDPRPIQLVFRRRPRPVAYLRAKPYTAYRPTEAQLRARLAFGEVARRARGRRLVRLPPAAEEVARELSGRSFGGTPREPKWLSVLRGWVSPEA